MSFEGYFTEHDDVLENYLGISDPEEMAKVESEFVPLRMAELLANPPGGELGMPYLCEIHRRLFSDLYPMAGKVRTVDIAKGKSVFCYVQYIDDEQRRIFRAMRQNFAHPLSQEDFAGQIAMLSADLNALHPFREGNGRAIRTFLTILAQRHNYQLDFSRLEHERLVEADTRAFYGEFQPLIELYERIITPERD